MSWSIKENANAPGTAYVVDDDGQELAFCQTIVHAKQIIVAAGSAAILEPLLAEAKSGWNLTMDKLAEAVRTCADLEQENAAMQALMELACADIIFFHSMSEGDEKVGFSVNVNDLFYPAADAEGFSLGEAIPLRDLYRNEGREGIVRWVQRRRNNLPLRPKVEARVRCNESLRDDCVKDMETKP